VPWVEAMAVTDAGRGMDRGRSQNDYFSSRRKYRHPAPDLGARLGALLRWTLALFLTTP